MLVVALISSMAFWTASIGSEKVVPLPGLEMPAVSGVVTPMMAIPLSGKMWYGLMVLFNLAFVD